jgi:hypothetical protein
MNNSELIDEIAKWNKILKTNSNKDLYELAFFKVFIKFEKFLSEAFENYSIGIQSDYGYCPERILNFLDVDHLYKTIKKDDKYVNHYENIKKLSNCIFQDNPFEIITTDANYSTEINNMKTLRDYIAHESITSRNRFIKCLLNNKTFISPNEFLLRKKKTIKISNYTYYTNIITEISDYLIYVPKEVNIIS